MPTLEKNSDGTPHIHQYVRAKKPNGLKDPLRYRCNHPDCSHWDYKVNLEGKRAMCGVCGQSEIILSYELLKWSRPPCFKCSNSSKSRSIKEKYEELKNMFGEAT
jgi:hypothetical protein